MGKKNKIKKDKISTAPDYDGEGRNKSLLGKNVIFTPEVIDDIHIKAQLGRYRTVSYTHLTLPTIYSV